MFLVSDIWYLILDLIILKIKKKFPNYADHTKYDNSEEIQKYGSTHKVFQHDVLTSFTFPWKVCVTKVCHKSSTITPAQFSFLAHSFVIDYERLIIKLNLHVIILHSYCVYVCVNNNKNTRNNRK